MDLKNTRAVEFSTFPSLETNEDVAGMSRDDIRKFYLFKTEESVNPPPLALLQIFGTRHRELAR
jgi:hypothetical protein